MKNEAKKCPARLYKRGGLKVCRKLACLDGDLRTGQ